MNGNGALPLARFTVLDLTRARAGPTCVRQLVDWGARAIKIEMPGGRSGDGMGGNRHGFDFQNLHRNKESPHPEPARARRGGRLQAAGAGRRHRRGELPP